MTLFASVKDADKSLDVQRLVFDAAIHPDGIIDTDVKFWHNLNASLKIVLLKFGIYRYIFLVCKLRFSVSLKFGSFFYHNFLLNGKF